MQKQEVSFILFGGTGDLTRRKLVPAFAKLIHDGKISESSTIIGVSRKNWTDEDYKKFLTDSAQTEIDKHHIKKLDIHFYQGDFVKDGLKNIRSLMTKCETDGCHRIYYLSTSVKFFPIIVQELKKHHLTKQKKGFTRVVFEKPFGNDLGSSENLDREIHKVFSEKDVFRIDHYLAKGTVQNLNVLKFTNPILHSTFHSDYVESVEVIVDEDLGVGNRLAYYNESGAIKDMIQSHLLQVLSLILMDIPSSLLPEKIHDEKVKILKHLEILPPSHHVLGQYESYAEEAKMADLNPKNVETFAKVILNCKTPKWDGVRLIVRTGKKLKKKFGEIKIIFKSVPPHIKEYFKGTENNKAIIGIYPKQDVTLIMNTRTPEQNNDVKSVKFSFSQEEEFGPNTTDEYAILLEEVVKGDQMLFTRSDEVRESWKIVEEIEKMRNHIQFVKYKDHSNPEE